MLYMGCENVLLQHWSENEYGFPALLRLLPTTEPVRFHEHRGDRHLRNKVLRKEVKSEVETKRHAKEADLVGNSIERKTAVQFVFSFSFAAEALA